MARNKNTGKSVSIPVVLQLDTDEALKDLQQFANETKVRISAFSSAKKILDGLEKSINNAFDGKTVGKFDAKILKIQQSASKAATDLLGMGKSYKDVMAREAIRSNFSTPESRRALEQEMDQYKKALASMREQMAKLSPLTQGKNDYWVRMNQGAEEARRKLQQYNEERLRIEREGGKGSDEWKRITEAMTSARRSIAGYNSQMKRAMSAEEIAAAQKKLDNMRLTYDKVIEKLRELSQIKNAVEKIEFVKGDELFLQDFTRLVAVIKSAELEIENLKNMEKGLGDDNSGASDMRRGFYLMRTIIRDMEKGLRKLSDKMTQFAKSIANAVKNMFNLNKESRKATGSLNNGFKHALQNVLRYGFGIRSLFFLFRRLRKYALEALGEMAKTFPEVNTQMSRAVTALNQMKGALGTAIQPLLTVVVPVLEKIANLISRIMSLIGGVFATLTGQGKIYQAVATQTDYAASLDKTGASAKKAKKELEGYLSPIDEINKYQSKKDDDSGGGAGAGYKMIETPISDFSKKIADLLNRILEPFKKAWADIGPLVVASWKRAFNSLKKLFSDIGRDMLKVWEQPETLEMLKDVYRIFANIGDVVHFLAKNLDEAWNKNHVGLHILEKIRDIFAIIIDHIESATDATVEWAKNLDFYPLLNAIDVWLKSLKPVVDNIAGVLEDFYEQVLLPLGEWAVEEGGPKLIGVFIDFNNKVDWEGLRSKLSDLWSHLEPFAERVGEGLIQFIDDITEKVAKSLNSEELSTFLQKLGEWMDSITADDVTSALWDTVNAFVALKAAVTGLSILGNVAVFIKEIAIAAKGLETLGGIGTVLSTLGGITAIISGLVLSVKEFFDMWTNGWDGLSTILEALGIALVTIGVIILAPIEGAGVAIAAVVAAAVFAISQIAIAVHDNWDSIVAWYEANIKPAIDSIKETVSELIDAIVDWWNSDIKPVIDEVGSTVTDVWHQYIEPTGGYIKEMVQNLWTLIKKIWESMVKPTLQNMGTAIKFLWESMIKPVLGHLKEGFTATFRAVGTVIQTAVKLIGSLINSLMQILNGIIKFVTGVFTGDWTKAWQGIKDIFYGIINGVVGIFEAGVNLIVSALNALYIPVPWDWAQKVVGSDHIGFNIKPITLSRIAPGLAQGAVIPPNKEFMAVLGDQKNGTNIETPLSTMVEAFNTALSQNGGAGKTEITFVTPDRRTLAKYVLEGGRVIQTSTGRNPFELA